MPEEDPYPYSTETEYLKANPEGNWDKYKQDRRDYRQDQMYQQMMGVEGTEVPTVDWMGIYKEMAEYNKEKFEEYWPKSIEEGIKAGYAYDIAGQPAAKMATAFNMELADEMNNWLANLTKYGNAFMRGEADQMNQWILGQVQDVNKFQSREFYSALETAMPGIMETAGDYKASVDQMLAGELPEDVQDQISQMSAERGLAQGVYGPAYESATARSLGLSSLQMQQSGQAAMPGLMGVTQALMAPIATPNIYQNVMMQPTPYTPQPAYVQPSNIPGIAGNYLSAIMGSTMMQPQAGVQAGLQAQQIQTQVQLANTQLQYAQASSGLNYAMDQQAMAQQYEMFKQQMNMQQRQQWFDLAGSVIGGAASIVGGL